jgi:hypothetical protein
MMTTNVPMKGKISGTWRPVTVESGMYTAQPTAYVILWFPDTDLYKLVEETSSEKEQNLMQLFAEFAEKDMKMAESGLAEYNAMLVDDDREC